jgi:hypothetical protein
VRHSVPEERAASQSAPPKIRSRLPVVVARQKLLGRDEAQLAPDHLNTLYHQVDQSKAFAENREPVPRCRVST